VKLSLASAPAPPPPAPVLALPDPAEHAARASLQLQIVQATEQMSSLSRQMSTPQKALQQVLQQVPAAEVRQVIIPSGMDAEAGARLQLRMESLEELSEQMGVIISSPAKAANGPSHGDGGSGGGGGGGGGAQPPSHAPPRPSSKMLAFLRRLGLDHYAHGLRREEVDLDVLATLDDAELVQMGVATVGARKRLRQALDEYKRSGRLLAAEYSAAGDAD
jgi:hypothetical protein